MRRVALVLALLAVAGVSCVGGGRIGGGSTGTGGGGNGGGEPSPAVAPGSQAMPALPVAHGGSTIPEVWIFGKDTYQRSSGAVEQDTALELEPTGPAGYEWAMYRINLAHTLGGLRVRMDTVNSGAYVGLSNHRSGAREFNGPYSGDAVVLPYDGQRYEAAPGIVYCLVVAAGSAVTVKQVIAKTVFGEPVAVSTETVPSSWYLEWPALAVVDGVPAVSYGDWDQGTVRFARALDPNGIAWAAPVELKPNEGLCGDNIRLTEVNGRPAVCCLVWSSGLSYIQALDASGATWRQSVEVGGPDEYGWPESMAIVEGAPAIAYMSDLDGSLCYVRAVDEDGSAWGTPVTVDVSDVGYFRSGSSLAVVDGRPAITYFREGPGVYEAVFYVRALDATGNKWGTPVVADPYVQCNDARTSLTVVNGNPAIVSRHRDLVPPPEGVETRPGLHYVRALDVDGAEWGTPIVLDSDGEIGQWPSLAVVGGNPAAVYDSGSVQGDKFVWVVRYVSALDANGDVWDSPVVVDVGQTYGNRSLIVANGRPAVAYVADLWNGMLQFPKQIRFVRQF